MNPAAVVAARREEQLPEAFQRPARTWGDFRNPGSEFAIIANRWSSTWWKKDLGAHVLGEDRGKWKFTES